MQKSRKPLAEYLVGPDSEWTKLPQGLDAAAPAEWPYTDAWFKVDDSCPIHVIASVRDCGTLQVLHVTISPLFSLCPYRRREDLQEAVAMQIFDILREFFGTREFVRAPDDARRPDCKHYLSLLK